MNDLEGPARVSAIDAFGDTPAPARAPFPTAPGPWRDPRLAGQFYGIATPRLALADGQEMDKSAYAPTDRLAKLLTELVELRGIEPLTS